MSLFKHLSAVSRALLGKVKAEQELDDELREYLAQNVAGKMEAGMSAEESQRAARMEMGSLDAVKEQVHAAGWESRVENVMRDLRFGLRTLRKNPAFSILGVATLAIGIGANAALFSVVQAVLFKPLPYPSAGRLMHIFAYWPGGFGNITYPDYVAALERSHSFADVAACESWGSIALTGPERAIQLRTAFVTPNYLELLGAPRVRGRIFRADENTVDGGHAVAVLSFAVWQQQYGSDPGIIGRVIQLNHAPYVVIGVLGQDFHDLVEVEDPRPEIWLPTTMARSLLGQAPLSDQAFSIYWGLGLLKPGVSEQQARHDLAAVASQMEREQPKTHRGRGMDLQPVSAYANGMFRRPAVLLMIGAGLILLIGCMNIANSMLVRIALRRREMAMRRALGASSKQLARQLFLECGLLAFAGGVAGLLLALWLTGLLGQWVHNKVSSVLQLRPDGWVAVVAIILSLDTTLVLGLVSVLDARRVKLWETLGQSGRQGMSLGRSSVRKTLVVAEIGFSVMLVIGAGLMLRSFGELVTSGLAFRTDHLLTFRVSLSGVKYNDKLKRTQFAEAFTQKEKAVPGIESVSLLGPSMLGHATWVMSIFPQERHARGPEDFVQTFRHSISPGTLGNLGITLLHGREFTRFDTAQSPDVAIISESVAREFWPQEDAVGKQLNGIDPTRPPITVVGVAADARHRQRYDLADIAADWPLGGLGPQRDLYQPYAQRPNSDITVALRINGATSGLAESVIASVAALDRDLAVDDVRLLDDRIREQNQAPAVLSLLMAGYALLALVLAALGVYSVMLQSVTHRSQEIGIRMALGAQRSDVLSMLLKEGMSLSALGILSGLSGALVFSGVMSHLLYGISTRDPLTFLTVVPILILVALAACLLPALRALRVDPLATLRCD
ncbi:MAG TPA: ABC transporter permease [Candidatus Angelobacter sp.]|nr:ABC transporter permease [Candidatus Angelobacter sp.]